MAVQYASITAANLVKLVADALGEGPNGVASSGTTTTIVDTNAQSGLAAFSATDDARVVPSLAYIWAGTNIGAQRRVSALNITTITATVAVAYASAIDNTSKYVILRRWDGGQILDALYQAQRMLTYEPSLGKGILLETGPLRHIQLGNALLNPTFDLYSTANVPDSWTTTNMTATSETTVTYGGARRSLKLVTDGVNVANLTQSLAAVGQFPSSFEVTAWVWCETASELFIRVNDGVDNHDSATKHGGTGWEELKVTVTPSALATKGTDAMTVALRSTTAGSTITFYVQEFWCPRGSLSDHRYALDADLGLVALGGYITVLGKFGSSPNSDVNVPRTRIGPNAWEVDYSATRAISLHIGSEWNGHVLELNGWKIHPALTAASTTWTGDTDALVYMAAAILEAQKTSPVQTPSIRDAASPSAGVALAAKRLQLIAAYGTPLGAAHKVVEAVR